MVGVSFHPLGTMVTGPRVSCTGRLRRVTLKRLRSRMRTGDPAFYRCYSCTQSMHTGDPAFHRYIRRMTANHTSEGWPAVEHCEKAPLALDPNKKARFLYAHKRYAAKCPSGARWAQGGGTSGIDPFRKPLREPSKKGPSSPFLGAPCGGVYDWPDGSGQITTMAGPTEASHSRIPGGSPAILAGETPKCWSFCHHAQQFDRFERKNHPTLCNSGNDCSQPAHLLL